jgi:two-component system phosphate regulon sensor histidine kinase PhoR
MIDWIIAGAAWVIVIGLVRRLLQVQAHARDAQQHALQLAHNYTAQLAQKDRLRDTLLKTSSDVLLVVDDNQTILFANSAAEALLGQNLVGETLIGAMRQPELATLIQDAQMILGEGVERRIEYEHRIMHARAVVSKTENDTFAVLMLRDVTEMQRLERSRRDMVANITHELSTPITTIGLLAETVLSFDGGKPKKTYKMARDIQRETETLAHLVQEMRDLSLIESGQMPIRMTPISLSATVKASIEPLLTLAEGKTQIVNVSVPDNIYVLGDDLQLRRALKNILHNALKFSPEGSTIEVIVTSQDGEAIIAVRDEGPGLPAENLARVFERFFQVDRARRNGTGLGLAIVRHIVQAHGGRVWVESVEGKGATFYIALAFTNDQPI